MLDDFSQVDLKQINIVVLTGAGISAESGLKTFRDNNGLWENHQIQDVATPEGFEADPNLVYDFYNHRRAQLLSSDVRPNEAHLALAKLEAKVGKNFTLITQNVDNLHQRAGSKNVLHMHGSLLSARCLGSDRAFNLESDWLDSTSQCNCCQPSHGLRPDIVWFGEIPKYMRQIEQLLSHADMFISIGTSGTVYPAAGFVSLAKQSGAHTVELNMEPSSGQSEFNLGYYGPATTVVSQFVDSLIEGK